MSGTCQKEARVEAGPIRILTVIEAAESITGVTKPVFEFAREARRPGATPRFELSIVTFVRGQGDNAFTRAVREQRLPIEVIPEAGRYDFAVLDRLREVVRRRQPEILWTNSVKSHFLVRLAGLHRQVKWVAAHHGYTATSWRARLYSELDRWSLRGALQSLTVCGSFAEQLVEHGVKREKIHVQHSPIRSQGRDASLGVELRRRSGISEEDRVVLSVGRLSREKGHAALFEAVERMRNHPHCPPLRVLIVGDGPERASLSALVQRLDLGGVVSFCGYRENVQPYYAAADLFVLSSQSEGSPNVLLEAMDAGVPVIATRVGGIPEMVEHERSGLLVERGNTREMSGQMLRALMDDGLRGRLITGGREALASYTPENYFRKLAAFFEQVATGRI